MSQPQVGDEYYNVAGIIWKVEEVNGNSMNLLLMAGTQDTEPVRTGNLSRNNFSNSHLWEKLE